MGSITLRQAIRRILEDEDMKKLVEKMNKEMEAEPMYGYPRPQFPEGVDEETEGNNAPIQKIQTTVDAARKAIKEGLYRIGDVVLEKYGVQWRLVDISGASYTLMSTTAFTYAPFARPDKAHPFGSNKWEDSQIRMELNTLWLERLFGEEKNMLITSYSGIGKLFLLSEEEVGFKQTEDTLDYFRLDEEHGVGYDELEKRRTIHDYEGDECTWWLRSPNPGVASNVRCVLSDGSLGTSFASLGHGAVAACII